MSDIGLGSEMFYRYVYPYNFCIFDGGFILFFSDLGEERRKQGCLSLCEVDNHK